MLYWLLDTAHGTLRYISVRTTFAVLTALAVVLWGGTPGRLTDRIAHLVGPNVSASPLIVMIGAAQRGDLVLLSAVFIASLMWMNLFNPYVWIVLGTSIGFGLIGLYQDYQATIDRNASRRGPFVVEAMIALAASVAVLNVGRVPLAPSLFWLFLPLSTAVLVGSARAVNHVVAFRWPTIIGVMIASASLCGLTWLAGNIVFAEWAGIHPAPGAGELAVVSGALLGTGLGASLAAISRLPVRMGAMASLAFGVMIGVIAVAVNR